MEAKRASTLTGGAAAGPRTQRHRPRPVPRRRWPCSTSVCAPCRGMRATRRRWRRSSRARRCTERPRASTAGAGDPVCRRDDRYPGRDGQLRRARQPRSLPLQRLLRRLPDLRLDLPRGGIRWRGDANLRGLVSLLVAFSPDTILPARPGRTATRGTTTRTDPTPTLEVRYALRLVHGAPETLHARSLALERAAARLRRPCLV